MYIPRYYLAILAIACLLGALAFVIWPPGPGYEALDSFLWRLGALIGVLWLAYPDLMRIPRWVALAVPVAVIVLVKWPKMIFALVPAVIALAALQRFLRQKK